MTAEPKFNSMRKCIEELDERRPIFMSPKPVSPKRMPHVSILGKRKFNDAFENETFDDTRYGQYITCDFFNRNIGHCVIQAEQPLPKKETESKTVTYEEEQEILQWSNYYNALKKKETGSKTFTYQEEQEILEWCDYYRTNMNLFNV